MLLQFDANNSLSIIWQKVSFATAEVGDGSVREVAIIQDLAAGPGKRGVTVRWSCARRLSGCRFETVGELTRRPKTGMKGAGMKEVVTIERLQPRLAAGDSSWQARTGFIQVSLSRS